MTDLCPTDGRHHGWAGVRITIGGVVPFFPFVEFRRFLLCSHADHADDFLHRWPAPAHRKPERGWGWIRIWSMLPNYRRASFRIRMYNLSDADIKRIYDTMVWVSS